MHCYHYPISGLITAIAYLKWILQQNSDNPYVGRELSGLLRQAGFTNIKASASEQCNESLSSVILGIALRLLPSE
ncbi:hypothetical protein [uncultured Nostoc sp.]|uniref:hypothetical protein n=1 Tax=uncultured Nostoc sp. TaxID=340711 RepID=UPI0035CAACC6